MAAGVGVVARADILRRAQPLPAVCILGGTGFVGRHLATRLAHEARAITIPTRSVARHRDLLVMPRVELVQADVLDPAALRTVCAGHDVVINLVGILNERRNDGRGFARVHEELVARLIEVCRELGIRRVLHVSALGADAGNGPSHYLRSKGRGERLLREASDLGATIFRPAPIFGQGDGLLFRFARLLRLPVPVFPVPRAHARMAPVYVGDVVEAIVRALQDRDTRGEVYELCGPKTYELIDIVRAVARTIGVHRAVVAMPDALARIQARVLDFVPGKPFSSDNYRSLTVDGLCSGDGLARLGISPRSLEPVLGRLLGPEARQARYDRYRRRVPG